jgi:hypothetical protein
MLPVLFADAPPPDPEPGRTWLLAASQQCVPDAPVVPPEPPALLDWAAAKPTEPTTNAAVATEMASFMNVFPIVKTA